MTQDHNTFSFINPPIPAALMGVRLRGEGVADLFEGKISDSVSSIPLVSLKGVDEGLLSRSVDGSWLFIPHGGGGIANLLRTTLRAKGFREREALSLDSDFAAELNRYQRSALELLPWAPSPAATKLLLRAMNAALPDAKAFDVAAFKRTWVSVRPHLSLPRVVLSGPANAGKSSLFNALVEGQSAIVSDIAGTTRDVLTARWELEGGYAVELCDMAGFRESPEIDSPGEREGLAIGSDWVDRADLVLALFEKGTEHWQARNVHTLRVATKCDDKVKPAECDLAISVQEGWGLYELEGEVARKLFPALPPVPFALSEKMANDDEEGFCERWFG